MRDEAGALQRGSLQARNRQEALQQIRAMGSTPVSVTEGSVSKTPFVWQPAWTRAAVLLGVAVVLITGIVLWLQRLRTPPPSPEKNNPPPPKVTEQRRPEIPKKPETLAQPRKPLTNLSENVKQLVQTADEKRTERETRFGPMPKEPLQEDSSEKQGEKEDTRPFKSASEQLLSMALSGRPGDLAPPLPLAITDDLEEDAARAFQNVIYVSDDDSEETIQHRINVAEAKEHMKELKETAGWTTAEYLKAIEAQRREDAELKMAIYQELERMTKNPSLSNEQIRAELVEINEVLAERGIPPITEEELVFPD
jgi:hypothetical protein